MTTFLRDLALAHQKQEGWFPGSSSWRHNNPGNLRWHPSQATFGGVRTGTFTTFPSYEQGFAALMADLQAKLTGRSSRLDYSKNLTLLDYVKVYAPAADRNDPVKYAQAIINRLPQYHLSLSTPLTYLAQLIYTPIPEPDLTPNAQKRRAERLAQRSQEPMKSRILRAISILFPPRP